MKLQTQFALLLAIFCLVFLLLSVSIFDTSLKASFIYEQEEIADSIANDAYELNYLTSDLFFHLGEKRQNIQIESKIKNLTNEINALLAETPEEQIQKDRIRENLAQFETIYTQSLASVEQSAESETRISPELVQVAWSRVAVQNQGIIFATSQLSQILHIKSDLTEQTSRILVILLMGVFLLILFFSYIFFNRRVLTSIAEITKGTQIIGLGNLNYVIPKTGEDEIGDLSDNFNLMTQNLKLSTTSVDLLEEEINERQRVELSLRESENRFRSLFESMTSGCAIYAAADDGQDFIFQDFNKAAEQIEQISRNDLIGRRVTEVFPSVKDFGIFKVFQRVWKTGMPEFFPEAFYEDSRTAGSWRESWVYKTGSGEIVAIYNDISTRKLAEEALRESEERFKIIAMNSPDIISIQDQDFRYEWVINPAIGLLTEEMIGKTDADLTDPVQAEQVMSLKRKVMETGESLYLEIPLKDSTGKEYIYEGSYTPKYDSNGNINGIISYFKDVTERNRSETELKNSEIRFRRLFEAAKDGILIIDYDSEKIIQANPYIETLLGYPPSELIGKTVWDIGPIRDLVESKRVFEELKTKDYIRYEDLPLETKTGTVREVEFVSNVYLVGNAKVIQCNIRDISERIQAERAVKESEERFRIIAMNSPDIISIQDKDFRYEWAINPVIGLLSEEIIGKTDAELTDPVQAEQMMNLKRKVMETGESLYLEIPLKDSTGKEFIYEGSYTPKYDSNGTINGVISYLRDVTDRKQTEKELQNSEIRFRRLFEAAKDGILIIEFDSGKILLANPFIEMLLGYPPSELIGKSISDIGPIRDIVESKRVFEELKTKDYVRYEDLPLESKTGIVREVEFVSNVYLVDNIKVIQCNIRDISDRIEVERSFKESEERLRYAIEAGEFGTWTLDLTTGLLVCSPRFNQIMGQEKPSQDWTVTTFLDQIPPDERDSIEQNMRNSLCMVEPWDFECRITRPDGEIRWIWIKGALQFNVDNEMQSIHGLIQDITPRKHAADELQVLYTNLESRVQERTIELEMMNQNLENEIVQRTIAEETNLHTLSVLNAIIESTENGILVIDTFGTVTKINHQFTDMWRIDEKYCDSDNCTIILEDILHQLKNPEYFERELQNVRSKSEQDNYYLIELSDNSIFEWYTKPQKIGTVVIGRVWTFRDITRQKEMEDLIVKSLREKEILLKEIHHRVKNNMQVISSLLYMQTKTCDNLKTRDILIESQNRIKSIALVHESLYQSPNLENIDYIEYLRKIIRFLFESFNVNPDRISSEISGEKIYLDIDKAIPCSLILNEMISNSLKYAFPSIRKGIIRIAVTSRSDNYIITYTDNGVGIPAEISLDHTSTLGLQLISGLTSQLNGTIELLRENGTMYIITFPMRKPRN